MLTAMKRGNEKLENRVVNLRRKGGQRRKERPKKAIKLVFFSVQKQAAKSTILYIRRLDYSPSSSLVKCSKQKKVAS